MIKLNDIRIDNALPCVLFGGVNVLELERFAVDIHDSGVAYLPGRQGRRVT